MKRTKQAKQIIVKPMDFWMKHYDRKAKELGWSLFDADGEILIQKIDDPKRGDRELGSDQDALNAIVRSTTNRKMCLTALYFDGRVVNKEVDIPVALQV